MIDRSTRWLEATPLKSMDANALADAFISTWVARFGVPQVITTDQGTQFTSAIWQRICCTLGVEHITTTAYHPQINGMVERRHRQLKDSLRARLADSEWPLHLPWVLLALRAAPKEHSNISSAELVFGCSPALPGEFLHGDEKAVGIFLERLKAPLPLPTRKMSYAEAACMPSKALMSSTYVYVRRGGTIPPLAQLYAGPFLVKEKTRKYFVVEMGDRLETV
jgi:transposase InsO family protein